MTTTAGIRCQAQPSGRRGLVVQEPATGGQLSFPVRSYRETPGKTVLQYTTRGQVAAPAFTHGQSQLFEGDCVEWLAGQEERTIHAVVTDPPYGRTAGTSASDPTRSC